MTPEALWITAPEQAEHRPATVEPGPGEVRIRTLYSGISRGTERLVFQGKVPPSEYNTMRAPFQEGAFPFPVKYGYAAVGVIEGPERAGETVFTLSPHQTHIALPADAAMPVPDTVPPARAILAANMETAMTIIWDAQVSVGDRVAVVGAGVVGSLAGYLATQIPGTEVTLIDTDTSRAALADTCGCAFATPGVDLDTADVVIHASATAAGLTTAINLAGPEAAIVEASWYGTQSTAIPLGGRFHQRRLKIVGSQVGTIPPHRAPRWNYTRRLQKALTLLVDPKLDALISGETPFSALPAQYGEVLSDPATLCHRVRYDG